MPQNKPRVSIPRKINEVIQLAQVIQSKDAELGNQSPLSMLEWEARIATIQAALAAQERADTLRSELEQA